MKPYNTPILKLYIMLNDICTASNTAPSDDPWDFDFDWEET